MERPRRSKSTRRFRSGSSRGDNKRCKSRMNGRACSQRETKRSSRKRLSSIRGRRHWRNSTLNLRNSRHASPSRRENGKSYKRRTRSFGKSLRAWRAHGGKSRNGMKQYASNRCSLTTTRRPGMAAEADTGIKMCRLGGMLVRVCWVCVRSNQPTA